MGRQPGRKVIPHDSKSDLPLKKDTLSYSVYVDASDSGNVLSFHISAQTTVKPLWNILISQYNNDFSNKAPSGCLQYHFGGLTGQIRSFNWKGGEGQHLANQNHLICIRREATMNRICYSQAGGTVLNDFRISYGVAAQPAAMGKVGNQASV